MTLSERQIEAMWHLMLAYAYHIDSLGRVATVNTPYEKSLNTAAANLLAVESEETPAPRKEPVCRCPQCPDPCDCEHSREASAPATSIETILMGVVGPGDPHRIRTHIDEAIRLLREERAASEREVTAFKMMAQSAARELDEARERIEKALNHIERDDMPAAAMPYCPEVLRILRGEGGGSK